MDEKKSEPVTRDQVERIVCALITSPKKFAKDGRAVGGVTTWANIVDGAIAVAEEINSRNFAASTHEQAMVELLADTIRQREGRKQFADQMARALAMAQKEMRGKSDG